MDAMQRLLPKKCTSQSTRSYGTGVLKAMVTLAVTVKLPIKFKYQEGILCRTHTSCPKSEHKWLPAEMHSST